MRSYLTRFYPYLFVRSIPSSRPSSTSNFTNMESLSTVEAYPRSSGTQTAVVLMLSKVRVSGSTLPVVAMVYVCSSSSVRG